MRFLFLIILVAYTRIAFAQDAVKEQKGFVIDIDSNVRIWMPGKFISSASETDFPLKQRIVMSQAAWSYFGVLKYSVKDVRKMLAKRKVKLTDAFAYAVERNLQDSARTVVFNGRVQELLKRNEQVNYRNGMLGNNPIRYINYRPNRTFKNEYTEEVLIYLDGNLYTLSVQGTDGYEDDLVERLFNAMLDSFTTTKP